MDDKRINILRNFPINQAVNKMAIPAIIGFLVMAVYNMVDTIYVSWLGYQATSAAQVVFPLMMVASSIGLAFGIGGASYVSRLLGKKQFNRAKQVISITFVSSIVVGLMFYIAVILNLNTVLRWFGASPQVLGLAADYAKYIVFGSLFVLPSMVLNNTLRSEGSASYSMLGMGFGALINIVLDPIFIFGLDLGMEGAAMATALSEAISFFILLSFYIRKKTVVSLNLRLYRFDLGIYGQIFKIGIPTFARQVLTSIAIALLNRQAGVYGGDILLAALGISTKLVAVPMYYVFGMSQGIQTVTGYNFGAGQKQRVRQTIRYGFCASFVGALVMGGVYIVFSSIIIDLFRPTAAVKAYALELLVTMSLAIMLMALSNVVSVFYQALGKGKEAMVLSIARQGLFFIPILYFLPRLFGINGLIYAQLAADALTLLLSLLIYGRYLAKDGLSRDIQLAHKSELI